MRRRGLPPRPLEHEREVHASACRDAIGRLVGLESDRDSRAHGKVPRLTDEREA
jgi:hypothetical protein